MTASTHKPRRKWFWVLLALLLAVLLFIKDFAVELLAPSLQKFACNHPYIVYAGLGLGLVAALIAAGWEFVKPSEPSAEPPPTPLPPQVHVTVTAPPAPNLLFPIRNSLHQLPAPPRDFTGRKVELRALLDHLEGGAIISGIQGQGGIGKTVLALKLAEAVANKFPGVQIFLDLQGMSAQPMKTTAAMEHVIRSFHPKAGQLPDSVSGLQPLYQSALQTAVSEERRVLLLFDNAKDRAQVEPLIPPAGCVMIITSRAHFTLPGMHEQSLVALPLADARELLTRLCDRCGADADELTALCGCLPLALRVAGSFLRERRDYLVARYLEKLRVTRLEQLPEVTASLKLSCEQLPPELQSHWRALSVFPASFDLAAAAAVLGVDEDKGQDALSDLALYSLLDWDEMARRYRWHDLARDYSIKEIDEAERQAAQFRHATYYRQIIKLAGTLIWSARKPLQAKAGLV